MAANGYLQNGYMQNEHLFLAAQQRLPYGSFLVTFQFVTLN